MRSGLYLTMALSVLSQLQRMYTLAPAPARALLAAPALAPAPFGNATIKDALFKDGLGKDLNLAYLMPAQAFTIAPVRDESICFGAKLCAGGSWVEQANVTYGDNPQNPIHVCICQDASFTMQALVQEYSTVSHRALVFCITKDARPGSLAAVLVYFAIFLLISAPAPSILTAPAAFL